MQTIMNDDRNGHLEPLIGQLKSKNIKHYINTRIIPQMQYYSNLSKKYKKQYRRWMILSIIIGAAIPIASVLADGGIIIKIIIAAFGSGITAINAYLTLENSKDLWYSYRHSREILLSTLYCYLNDSEVFAHLESQEKKDALLVEMCEKEITKENSNWVTIIKSK